MDRFTSLRRWAPWCGAALVGAIAPLVANFATSGSFEEGIVLEATLFLLGGVVLGFVFSSEFVAPTIACVIASPVLVAALTRLDMAFMMIFVAPALAIPNVPAALLGGYAGASLRRRRLPAAFSSGHLVDWAALAPAALGATWHLVAATHTIRGDDWAWVPVAVAGASVSSAWLGLRARPSWAAAAAGVLPVVAFLLMLRDTDRDPTSHNLWPLEMAMLIVLSAITTSAAFAFGWLLPRLKER